MDSHAKPCAASMRSSTSTHVKALLALTATALALTAGAPARATIYALPDAGVSVLGEDQRVQTVYEDTLYDLARRYSLGSDELIRVNPGIDPWLPGAGKTVLIPGRHILPSGPREGVVVNIAEHRLYYYPKARRHQPRQVITYPVSIGKMDWRTPLASRQSSPSRGIRGGYPPRRCVPSMPRMAISCRRAFRPVPTIRWAIAPCAWPPARART